MDCFDDVIWTPWLKEGISEEMMELFEIKFYNRTQQIIIPIRDINDVFVGAHVRNTNPDATQKYDVLRLLDGTEYKFPTNEVLYGLNYHRYDIESSKKVILCEAPKSVMQAPNYPVVGMFGMTLSQQQLILLLKLLDIEDGSDEAIKNIKIDNMELNTIEKITLEEYAARLGKKLQEEKKTNDLADMLYSHYSPSRTTSSYDSVTKLEKIEF